LGDREFRLTFYSVIWKAGLVSGYQRVQDTLVLSESGDEYTGHAQVDFLDASRKGVFSTNSDVKGTKLETPAMLIAPPAEEKQLMGVWAKKIKTSGDERTLLNIDTFRADGSFTGSSDKTLPYGSTMGLRAGRCVAMGTREFQLTFYAVRWNKEGVVDLFQRVHATMTLSESGDEFTEHSQWEVRHYPAPTGRYSVLHNAGGLDRERNRAVGSHPSVHGTSSSLNLEASFY
jgi:hypothetical protein